MPEPRRSPAPVTLLGCSACRPYSLTPAAQQSFVGQMLGTGHFWPCQVTLNTLKVSRSFLAGSQLCGPCRQARR